MFLRHISEERNISKMSGRLMAESQLLFSHESTALNPCNVRFCATILVHTGVHVESLISQIELKDLN